MDAFKVACYQTTQEHTEGENTDRAFQRIKLITKIQDEQSQSKTKYLGINYLIESIKFLNQQTLPHCLTDKRLSILTQ